MQQPQRLALPTTKAARRHAATVRAQGHHVPEDLAGGGVRDERHAAG